jgi:hypothetical protein
VEAIRRARKLARKKMQREGLRPMKPGVAPRAHRGKLQKNEVGCRYIFNSGKINIYVRQKKAGNIIFIWKLLQSQIPIKYLACTSR